MESGRKTFLTSAGSVPLTTLLRWPSFCHHYKAHVVTMVAKNHGSKGGPASYVSENPRLILSNSTIYVTCCIQTHRTTVRPSKSMQRTIAPVSIRNLRVCLGFCSRIPPYENSCSILDIGFWQELKYDMQSCLLC